MVCIDDLDNDKSIRNAVIQILIAKRSMSARKLYELIKSSYVQLATYPAVYKTLKVMTAEKKLDKQNREFSINMQWIDKLKTFVERVEKSQTDETAVLPLEEFQKENATATLYFKNYEEADRYRKELQMDYQLKFFDAKKPYCAFYRHFKSPIFRSGKILQEIKTLKDIERGGFLVGRFDTPLDRWCVRFYMGNPNISVKIVPSISHVEKCETMILGDVIVQTFIPDNIKRTIDSTYEKTKSIDDINVMNFYEKVYKAPANIKITILNNRHIADILRNEILAYFSKKKV